MRQANDEVLLIAQIETPGGVEQADAIAAVEGIDALWIGQYDLTASLGIPGRFDTRTSTRRPRRVVEACRRQGKTAVLGSGDVETLRARPGGGLPDARLPGGSLDLPAGAAAGASAAVRRQVRCVRSLTPAADGAPTDRVEARESLTDPG